MRNISLMAALTVLLVFGGVSQATTINTFQPLTDQSAHFRDIRSYLDTSIPAWHNVKIQDEFGVESVVPSGTNLQVGFYKFVPGGD